MKFSKSLQNNYEFRRLYSKGSCTAGPLLALYCRKNRSNTNQIGITVSNKLGKAVVRNRVRRRMREIYRLNESNFLPGYDIVAVARTRSTTVGYHELEAEFMHLAAKLKLLKSNCSGVNF